MAYGSEYERIFREFSRLTGQGMALEDALSQSCKGADRETAEAFARDCREDTARTVKTLADIVRNQGGDMRQAVDRQKLPRYMQEDLLKALGLPLQAPPVVKDSLTTQQKEKADGADFDTLRQYTAEGFTLYAQKPGKTADGDSFRYCVDWRERITKYTKGTDQPKAAIKNEQDLKTAIGNGVKLFAFLPSERNYLCFDIDSGHANGVDGLKVFADYFKQKGIAYDFFSSGAVYTETPSGGRHLYFKDWTDTERYLSEPLNNVEVRGRGNRKTLTAAGSVKNGTVYRLHGLLKDAPRLPNMLIKHITPPPMKQAPKVRATPRQAENWPATRKGFTLAALVDFVLADKAGSGRNNTAFAIGRRVGRQYDVESIIAECKGRPLFSEFPESELRTAINSGIKISKY